jgi:hypothetical protein
LLCERPAQKNGPDVATGAFNLVAIRPIDQMISCILISRDWARGVTHETYSPITPYSGTVQPAGGE